MSYIDQNGATIYEEISQYTPEWWAIRRGVPTASEFNSILTAKTMKLSAAADTYIAKLCADTLSFEYGQNEEFESFAMKRGTRIEPMARKWLEFDANLDVKQVGFVKSHCGRFGCSPDGLLGDDETVELKCPLPHTHAAYLLDGEVPSEYLAQVHGALIVTGRKRCRFISFCPGEWKHLYLVVEPNEYTQKLREALEVFWERYQAALRRIREM